MTAIKPLKRWDAADYLENNEDMVLYLNACIDDDSGDGSLIRAATPPARFRHHRPALRR